MATLRPAGSPGGLAEPRTEGRLRQAGIKVIFHLIEFEFEIAGGGR